MQASQVTPDSIEAFRNSLYVKGRSTETVRAYAADLTGLLTWMSIRLKSLETTPFEVAAAMYLNEIRLSLAPKTTCRKLTTFRTFASWAGYPTVLAEYKPPKPAKGMPKALPEGMSDARKMIACASTKEKKALAILCNLMAMRISEARSIRPSAFHFHRQGNYITVRGKGDKYRDIPISDEAWEGLQSRYFECLKADAPLVSLSDRGARHAYSRLAVQAGVSEHASSHYGRATAATTILNNTGNIRVAQEFLGHSSSTTTELYTQVKREQLREAAKL